MLYFSSYYIAHASKSKTNSKTAQEPIQKKQKKNISAVFDDIPNMGNSMASESEDERSNTFDERGNDYIEDDGEAIESGLDDFGGLTVFWSFYATFYMCDSRTDLLSHFCFRDNRRNGWFFRV